VASSAEFVELRDHTAVGWVHRDFAALGLQPFLAPLAPLPDAKGRGGVGILTVADRELVVRPYRRGGAFGALLRDRYAGPGRVRDELQVLTALRDEGVPVVAPVAAIAVRHGAFWRLRLCTERVVGALPLPAFLAAQPGLRRSTATAVGTVVRLAFGAGLLHSDLHPDNVLCAVRGSMVRIVLVDLDRARLQRPLPDEKRFAMLSRMQRYVLRHAARLPTLPSRGETMRCLRAIVADRGIRHALWRRLARELAKVRARRAE
jgi:hypothetical protein